MNLKTSAIALAVAGAVAAPVAVQADSGFYGSVRVGFQYLDGGLSATPSTDAHVTIRGYAARFGFRGETDMGNGLTGFGRYEFAVGTEGAATNVTRRHAYVGVKGDFGSILLGQTYHTYYNFISGPLDNPWWGAGYTWLGYPGRTAQGITYAGGSGNFGFGATLYMDGSSTDASLKTNDLDKFEIAANWQAGPVLLAVGVSDQDEIVGTDPGAVIGFTASGWETGIFTWGLNVEVQDDIAGPSTVDGTGIALDVLIGNGYIHYESIDLDFVSALIPDSTPTTITLGYTQSLGRQTTIWYEYQMTDYDVGASFTDLTVARAVLKYDWK